MTGIRIQYVRLEIRKWIIYMRHCLIGFCLVFLVAGALLVCCYFRISDTESQAVIQVALVIPGEQEELKRIAGMLKYLDSVRDTVAFVYPEEEELDTLFKNGEIQAAVLFGEDFYQDVNTGINTPLTIRLNSKFPGVELFQELLSDVIIVVDATEAASYAMIEAWQEHLPDMSLSDMENLIMADNVNLLMDVRNQVSLGIISLTGEVDLIQYYVTLFFFFFLLLLGFGFRSFYDPQNYMVEQKLRIYGVGNFFRSACKLAMMTIACFIYALIGFGICQLLSRHIGFPMAAPDIGTVMGLLCFAAVLACFYHGILLLSPDSREKKLILFLALFILLLIGGCIVPCSCLPAQVTAFAQWTPFYLYRDYLEALLFGGEIPYIGIIAWMFVFLAAGEGMYRKTGRDTADAYSYRNARKHFRRAFGRGGGKEMAVRIRLYLKWQLRRKSPLIIAVCFIILAGLFGSIRFPQWENRTILISGEENLCREIEVDARLNQVFQFVYEPDDKIREDSVKGGQVLGAVRFTEEEILLDAAAVSPEILVAKETVAAARYLYSQEELLSEECKAVFGDSGLAADVFGRYQEYMRDGKLFQVIYQEE